MKNILKALLIISVFLLSNACSKTGVDLAEKPAKDQANERIIEKASYSRWLSASVPYMPLGRVYKIISGTPPTLTYDVYKYGKVLVFERANALTQPYSLPFEYFFRRRSGGAYEEIFRRMYFKYHVDNITVYDSLVSKFWAGTPMALTTGYYYTREFRCIIVPQSLKIAANTAGLNWNDYAAVTSYFKIAP